jgi:hypothetical protein
LELVLLQGLSLQVVVNVGRAGLVWAALQALLLEHNLIQGAVVLLDQALHQVVAVPLEELR